MYSFSVVLIFSICIVLVKINMLFSILQIGRKPGQLHDMLLGVPKLFTPNCLHREIVKQEHFLMLCYVGFKTALVSY